MSDSLNWHLEKAHVLAQKARRLASINKDAKRIYEELNEIIEDLELYYIKNMFYDEAEVGTRLKYYEKRLEIIEKRSGST
jgi:transcriptional regulatory protein LevR